MIRSTRVVACCLAAIVLAGCAGKRVREAERAVLVDPGAVEVWVMLGDSYRAAHRKDDALAAYQRALALSPDSEEIVTRIRELSKGDVTRLEKKALRSPLDDELWGDVGDEYLARGENEKALTYYLYAFRLDPGDSEWQRHVVELGGLAQIVELVDTQLEGANDETLGDFGDMLREAGETERACELYERANALDPADSEWIEKVGQCGYGAGNYGMVGGYVGGDVGGIAEPGHYGVTTSADTGLVALGRSALASGERAKALEYFQAALLQDASDREALTGVMVLTGKTLVEVLETLTTRLGHDDEVWGDLGDAYVAVGRLDAASDAYRRAIELDPGDREWRTKLSILDPGASATPEHPAGEPLFQLPE